jgi:hypothetical protein
MKKTYEIIDTLSLKSKSILVDTANLVQDMADANRQHKLSVTIDATHSGRLTNGRVYPGKHMKKSVKSFLSPYPKPVLKNHDDLGDPIGRVASAKYLQLKQGEEFSTDYMNPGKGLGSGFIRLGVEIMDLDAIEKVADGRFQQVSTRQGFNQLNCSICGSDFAGPEPCEHYPGQVYTSEKSSSDKKEKQYLCYGITGPLSYREVSFVNIPGDDHAKITDFEMIHSDNEEPFVIHCDGDDMIASIDSLVLSDGNEHVDLMASRRKRRISSKDRELLTGKTIVAVGPYFDKSLILDDTSQLDQDNVKVEALTILGEEKQMKEQEVLHDSSEEVKEEQTNTIDTPASSVDSQEEPVEALEESSQEGVVAPETVESNDKACESEPSLSDDALRASLEALTKSLKEAEADKSNLSAELERTKGAVKGKEEEIERVRLMHQDALSELKTAYSSTLLNTRMTLSKADVSHVSSKEDFEKQLEIYVSRSLDSLKDSISDLAPELSEHGSKNGFVSFVASTVAEDKVESPVSNNSAKKDENSKNSKRVTKESALQELFG